MTDSIRVTRPATSVVIERRSARCAGAVRRASAVAPRVAPPVLVPPVLVPPVLVQWCSGPVVFWSRSPSETDARPDQNDMDQNDMDQNDLDQNDLDQNDMDQNDMDQNDEDQNDEDQNDEDQNDEDQNDEDQNDAERYGVDVDLGRVPVGEQPMIELPTGSRLVLASASPRRRELLASVGLDFDVRPADIDETPGRFESPTEYVQRLSLEKSATAGGGGEIVIGADTTVEVDGRILEKPVDDDDARAMLRMLSERSHHVHTAVTVRRDELVDSFVVTTEVTFVELSSRTIDWYVSTGEATDKAGAYGIQGAAAAFVERIDGSVTNVIGLPLAETLATLRAVAAG